MMRLARARSRDGEAAMERVTLAFAALMMVGTIVLGVAGQRAAAVARADAWIAQGPACPDLTAAAARAFGKPASAAFWFDGVRFARVYGYAVCGEITLDRLLARGRVPVCRFNSPGVVETLTPRGRFHFLTGVEPVTVTVVDGVPHCVLAAKLAPDWLRN